MTDENDSWNFTSKIFSSGYIYGSRAHKTNGGQLILDALYRIEQDFLSLQTECFSVNMYEKQISFTIEYYEKLCAIRTVKITIVNVSDEDSHSAWRGTAH